MTFAWLGWLLSAIVLLLLFVMGAILENSARFIITGNRAQGVVVGIDRDDSLVAPIVEFVTSTGERVTVTGRAHIELNSIKEGDSVSLYYDPANPRNAQLLLWREFFIVGILVAFILFVVLVWISCILISPESRLEDPLHILPSVIAKLKLSPTRFPLYFMLPVVIFSLSLGTYVLVKDALDLRANGIRTIGEVDGESSYNFTRFAMVNYTDMAGDRHSVKRALKPVSRLHDGDKVEVIYSLRNPGRGVVNTWDEIWFIPSFFAFFLLAMLWLAYLLVSGNKALGI